MDTPIFAGKGVTITIRHNPARKQRPQHTPPLLCEEHMIGSLDKWQMRHVASLIMRRVEYMALLVSESNILVTNGKKLIHVKLLKEGEKAPMVLALP